MCDNEIFYNNSQWDPMSVCAIKIKCSWMHWLNWILEMHFCTKKTHTARCIHKMQAILSVNEIKLLMHSSSMVIFMWHMLNSIPNSKCSGIKNGCVMSAILVDHLCLPSALSWPSHWIFSIHLFSWMDFNQQ